MIAPNPPTADLLTLVNAAYGLNVVALTRLPMGEDAASYLATARDDGRAVVRVERARTSAGGIVRTIERLEAIYRLTSALHERGGVLAQVVAPWRTSQGTFTCQFAERAVAVFPA
ncbi:MAG: hypothetical protein ABI068_13895, partial [Ktedonobacterales bacterium]